MKIRLIAAAVLLGLPLALPAAEPNIEPGLWEYTNTTRIEGAPMEIPEESMSSQECVTEEDLRDESLFLEDVEECEVSDLELGSDGMSYVMTCEEEGASVRMQAEMSFMGDRVSGNMSGEMESPMGELEMHVTIEGERIDDC